MYGDTDAVSFAGQELLVPIKAPQAAEAAAAHADSGDGAEATAQEVSAPTAAGAAARAAALGRWAGDTDEDAGPAEGEQVRHANAAMTATLSSKHSSKSFAVGRPSRQLYK